MPGGDGTAQEGGQELLPPAPLAPLSNGLQAIRLRAPAQSSANATEVDAGDEAAAQQQQDGGGLTPRGLEMLESLKRGRDPGCFSCFTCGSLTFLEAVEQGERQRHAAWLGEEARFAALRSYDLCAPLHAPK